MPDNRQIPFNQHALARWLPVAALLGLLGYLIAFFGQPSALGFVDEVGQPLPRWIDLSLLFFWENLAAGVTGHGRLRIGILDRLPILLGGIAWLGIAGWIGNCFVHRVKRTGGSRWTAAEIGALSILAGAALLSTLTLLLGWLGGLGSRWPLAIAIAVLLVASTILRRRGGNRDSAELSPEKSLPDGVPATDPIAARSLPDRWAQRLLPVATCTLGAIYVLGCLVTPWEFDVVEYHLQSAKEIHQAGVIAFNDHNVYSNMPLGAEMHTLAAMTLIGGEDGWWWGGLVGKLISGLLSLLGAVLLGGYMARRCGTWCGWSAAGLLLSAPGMAHVTMAGLIDAIVGTYVLAMLVVLSADWKPHWLGGPFFLASLFAGAAAACKYPAFLFAVVPLLGVAGLAAWRLSGNGGQRWRLVGALSLGLALTCLPWLAKNAWLTGNPVYPLATSVFATPGLDAAGIEQWRAAHDVPDSDGSPYGWSALVDSARQLFLASPFLSPTLVPLAACGLLASVVSAPGRSQWLRGWLALAVWMLAVWWLLTHRIDRFWLPVLPIYAATATLGVAWLARQLSLTLATAIVLLSIAYGGFIAASGSIGDNRFLVQLEDLRYDAGDDEFPGRLSPATRWINQHLDERNDRVLVVGEARVFDFEVPIEYATCFNRNPAESWLKNQSGGRQRENLKQAGITHILVHWGEIARYRSPGNYGFSDWPRRTDIDAMLDAGVVERVEWPFSLEHVELLRVSE